MSRSSKRWLAEHFADPFVRKAQQQGLRSRAAFKLEELDQRDRLIKPGLNILDLGAAPGGWSQYASKCLQGNGRIVAIDLLAMPAIPGVEFIQGDFADPQVRAELAIHIGVTKFDLVMSDMLPNLSGHKIVDQYRAMALAELALDVALELMVPNAGFLVKLFQGLGFEDYLKTVRRYFDKTMLRKPKASRDRSPEVYLLARGFKSAVVEPINQVS